MEIDAKIRSTLARIVRRFSTDAGVPSDQILIMEWDGSPAHNGEFAYSLADGGEGRFTIAAMKFDESEFRCESA
jgi:hypothetical protein